MRNILALNFVKYLDLPSIYVNYGIFRMNEKINYPEILRALKGAIGAGWIGMSDLLQVRKLSDWLATDRYNRAQAHTEITSIEGGAAVKPGTTDNQLGSLAATPAKRRATYLMDQVLSAPQFQGRLATTKVLIVGPRTEVEYFHGLSLGLAEKNITCIDLISYSPYCEVMDCHNITVADETYDVVVHGWVLPYSQNYWIMLTEALRVVKEGGVLAIGFNSEAFLIDGVDYIDHLEDVFPVLVSSNELARNLRFHTEEVLFASGPEFPREIMGQKCHLALQVSKSPLSQHRSGERIRGFESSLMVELLNSRKDAERRHQGQHYVRNLCSKAVKRFYGNCNFQRILDNCEVDNAISVQVVTAAEGLHKYVNELRSASKQISSGFMHAVFSARSLTGIQELLGCCPMFLGRLKNWDPGKIECSLSTYLDSGGVFVICLDKSQQQALLFFSFRPLGIEFQRVQIPSNFPVQYFPRLAL